MVVFRKRHSNLLMVIFSIFVLLLLVSLLIVLYVISTIDLGQRESTNSNWISNIFSQSRKKSSDGKFFSDFSEDESLREKGIFMMEDLSDKIEKSEFLSSIKYYKEGEKRPFRCEVECYGLRMIDRRRRSFDDDFQYGPPKEEPTVFGEQYPPPTRERYEEIKDDDNKPVRKTIFYLVSALDEEIAYEATRRHMVEKCMQILMFRIGYPFLYGYHVKPCTEVLTREGIEREGNEKRSLYFTCSGNCLSIALPELEDVEDDYYERGLSAPPDFHETLHSIVREQNCENVKITIEFEIKNMEYLEFLEENEIDVRENIENAIDESDYAKDQFITQHLHNYCMERSMLKNVDYSPRGEEWPLCSGFDENKISPFSPSSSYSLISSSNPTVKCFRKFDQSDVKLRSFKRGLNRERNKYIDVNKEDLDKDSPFAGWTTEEILDFIEEIQRRQDDIEENGDDDDDDMFGESDPDDDQKLEDLKKMFESGPLFTDGYDDDEEFFEFDDDLADLSKLAEEQ